MQRSVTTLTVMSDTHTEVPTAYPPPHEFAAQANATAELYREAEKDRLAFWAEQANRLSWDTPFTEVLDWSEAPFAKWFVGGKLNVAYNCVDRHVEAGNGDRVAIHWEGEPVGRQSRPSPTPSCKHEVCKAANALTELGLVAGDRVAIYMPMVPEAIVAMLACARLGVMHSVVFAGFSATALAARIEDAEAKLVITTDGQYRRGKAASLKEAVDEAVDGQESVEHVLVVRRTGIDTPWTDGRDLWWHETVERASHRTHPGGVRLRASAVPALHLGHHRQAQGHHAHLRRLPDPGVLHPSQRLRRQARDRCVLVHRRYRLGHRAHLHRLRAAVQRRHPGRLRGHAGLAQRAPALRGDRKVRCHNLLHGAHTDPDVHEVGREFRRRARPVQPAAAGLGR